MPGKRSGEGGNASKDPRGNLEAQKEYKKRFKKDTKNCTGFLHHDGPEILISNFRQQKTNSNTGLQSRCDLCNRLYFSIIQKPIKRIAAIAIWAEQSGEYDWRSSAPSSLVSGVEKCLAYWLSTKCDEIGCEYQYAHASYRDAAKVLTNVWKDLDKGPRVGKVKDDKTSRELSAPKFMEDLQAWASTGGTLYREIETSTVWDWWCELFDEDTAIDSAEYRAVKNGTMKGPVPQHPLHHFPWGSGNILETVQGHSAPGFNQVRSSQRVMPKASSTASRVYGYLVEGDRLGMAQISKRFKARGLSLGHSPAPLRWLGKDDPINAQGQPLADNVLLSDSLIDLYKLCMEDLDRALACVSWQVRETLVELTQSQVSFEEFTQKLQSEVEKYFDTLLEAIESGDSQILLNDLIRADPGKTFTVYEYRHRKVATWLANRPAAIKRKA